MCAELEPYETHQYYHTNIGIYISKPKSDIVFVATIEGNALTWLNAACYRTDNIVNIHYL